MKCIFLIVLSIFSYRAFSQELTESPQYLALELVGNAGHLSVNYDSRFAPKKSGLGFRIGVGGTWSYYNRDQISLNIPAGLNYLIGENKNFAEIGIVAVPEYYFAFGEKYFSFKTRGNLGYRYESRKGIMLNALWTPQLTVNNDFEPRRKNITKILWFGIGAGIRL